MSSAYEPHLAAAAAQPPHQQALQLPGFFLPPAQPAENPTWQQKLTFEAKPHSDGTASHTHSHTGSWQLPTRPPHAGVLAVLADGELDQLCADMADYGEEEAEQDEAYREAEDYAEYEEDEYEEGEGGEGDGGEGGGEGRGGGEAAEEEAEEAGEQQAGEGGQGEGRPGGAGAAEAAPAAAAAALGSAGPAPEEEAPGALPADPWGMTPDASPSQPAAAREGGGAAAAAAGHLPSAISAFGGDQNQALAAAASRLASKLPSRISAFGDGLDLNVATAVIGSSPRLADVAGLADTPAAGVPPPPLPGALPAAASTTRGPVAGAAGLAAGGGLGQPGWPAHLTLPLAAAGLQRARPETPDSPHPPTPPPLPPPLQGCCLGASWATSSRSPSTTCWRRSWRAPASTTRTPRLAERRPRGPSAAQARPPPCPPRRRPPSRPRSRSRSGWRGTRSRCCAR
jgi:hypothetical protein